MTNYFVSSADGDDTDDGTTMDDGAGGGVGAWETVAHAVSAGGLVPGDIVWVRRTLSEALGADLAPAYNGTFVEDIKLIGWPRAADASITDADWTNGSTTVDTIVGLVMDRAQHLGRYITGPDGETYMITLVTDGNTVTLLDEYRGGTVTDVGGACTIQADEDWVDDMGTEHSFDDSGWTIDEAAWDADPDDLPLLDFSGGEYTFLGYQKMVWYVANLDLYGDSNSILMDVQQARMWVIKGCLFLMEGTTSVFRCYNKGAASLYRCVFVGKGSDLATQQGIVAQIAGLVKMYDCAVYDMGHAGLYAFQGEIYCENVNSGVEVVNYDTDTTIQDSGRIWGRDIKLGLNVGPRWGSNARQGTPTVLSIENYQKVLGTHVEFNNQGSLTKLDVVAGSGDPYKRTGGADSVLEVLYDSPGIYQWEWRNPSPDQLWPIFIHEFEATADTKNYRYYVNAEEAVAATELWIEVEYVSTYDDATEYLIKRVVSTESISQQADNEDWTQYMEVTGITPAVGSKVRIKCYCSFYHATGKIYIDPKVVITDG